MRVQIQRIPLESFPVKKALNEVESAWKNDFWNIMTPAKVEFLRLKVAPLLRFAANVDVAAETFTHKCERLKLQTLHGQPRPDLLTSIAADVGLLPGEIRNNPDKKASADLALSQALAEATPDKITKLARDFAPVMKMRDSRPDSFLRLDLPDFIEARGTISLGEGGQQVLIEVYRQRVESRVPELVANHPALEAIRQGQEVSDAQLVDLERILHRELGAGDLHVSAANIRKAYGLKVDSFLAFLRHILALESLPDYGQVVQRAFERFIAAHHYNADQIRFLRSVQEVFLQKRQLAEADLYEPPLTVFGRNAVERFFTPQEIRELLDLLNILAA